MGGKGGREQGFGVGGVVFGEQDVGEGGDGLRGLRRCREGEIAAVGPFGGGQVCGGFGDLGGKEDVFGGLGCEIEGCEQLGGGGGGVGRRLRVPDKVEAGESAEGAGFERGRDVREMGRGEQLAAGLGGAVGAGEQQAERDVRGGEERVGGNGLAVAGFGGEGLWTVRGGWSGVSRTEGFEGEAEVVEELGVVGGLGVEVGEDLSAAASRRRRARRWPAG